MNPAIFFFLLISFKLFSSEKSFHKTNQAFDFVVVGENCYVELLNSDDLSIRSKSISMISNDKGELIDSNGYRLKIKLLPKKIYSLEITKDGEVNSYEKETKKKEDLGKLTSVDKVGNRNIDCFFKQGYVLK